MKRILTLGLIVAIGLGLLPWRTTLAGGNLGTNGDFEGAFVQANAQAQVARGWTPWFPPTPARQPDDLSMRRTYDRANS